MYEDDDDEIEEIRELMYDLLKDFPTGATSRLLEEQYYKRYVQTGMGRPLPPHWLHYVQQADEFEVKQLSAVTMLYLVNAESLATIGSPIVREEIAQSNNLACEALQADITETTEKAVSMENLKSVENQENIITACVNDYNIEPMSLITMPIEVCVQAYVTFATDPDNIFIRLCSWDPVPDYLYSALMRVPDTEHGPPVAAKVQAGQYFAAPINGVWERVRIIRKSEKFPSYWIVFAVDAGYYHIIAQSDLRQPSDAVRAFTKIFLARVKLSGVSPVKVTSSILSINGSRSSTAAKNESVQWSREAQQMTSSILTPQFSTPRKVELLPEGEWTFDSELKIPIASARIIHDGIDFAEELISMGYATKSSYNLSKF